jgi:ergothioneine biosynthesis protein EgtB
MSTLLHSPSILADYERVRKMTEELCDPLQVEDYVIQTMPDVSPTKWHLAHTTWFFEHFILTPNLPNYRPFHPQFTYLFNSYYNSVGDRQPRAKRGNLSRPTLTDILEYRHYVDNYMIKLLEPLDDVQIREFRPTLELGIHHEQQHQELILTDIKHVFASNPLHPIYRKSNGIPESQASPLNWILIPENIYPIGHPGGQFGYDNEFPSHKVFLSAFQIASRLMTNSEYLAFIEDNGYARPELWLSDGWDTVCREKWNAPLYWEKNDNEWHHMTLSGFKKIAGNEPVCHVSFYEADAFARWKGKRLLTEEEWETVSLKRSLQGNFLEQNYFQPVGSQDEPGEILQMFGDTWEWTASPYTAYPNYKTSKGALGEYNGKFMCNQMVLRGGSCFTPQSHIRPSYRNFFPPHARWQCTGIRLGDKA